MLHQESDILSLIETEWSNVDHQDISSMLQKKGGIDPIEGLLFYLFIIKYKPKYLIEFSPNKGYSTEWIARALRHLNQQHSFWTFEINKEIIPELKNNLKGFEKYITIIEGDALEEVPKTIYQMNDKPEFCFIDSNHNTDFAIGYTSKILPLLKSGCQVMVHDICVNEEGETITSLYPSGDTPEKEKGSIGELKVLQDYWKMHFINPFILHSITGGSHEMANTPRSDKFYEKIKDVTGYTFIDKYICPKIAIFNIP